MTGTILQIDGRDHWVRIEGSGPVVVLEPAIGDVGLTWGLVQPEVGEFATVFTHDRPGLGHSSTVPGPRDVKTMAAELRSALAAVSLIPPYILVGHSYASLTVRAFAHLHPEEAAGLVLVDGAHEDQMERFPLELDPRPMLAALTANLRELAESVRGGETIAPLAPVPESFPVPLAGLYGDATLPTSGRLEAAASEFEALEASQDQVRALTASPIPWIPLIALRHGVAQPVPGIAEEVNRRYQQTWQLLQAELAARSDRGEVRVAEGVGHQIHHDRPDLVIAAIRDLIS
jgi:pimeloyl-ACP methyl ester carboxylesterase